MPHTTTSIDLLVTKNYPFGHAVNTVANSVCWNLASQAERRARNLVNIHRAWVEIADRDAPGADHPGCGVSASSTGARRATGTQFGRSSASGTGARAASSCKRNPGISEHTQSGAKYIEREHKRNANFANASNPADFASNSKADVRMNRIQASRIVMSNNRRNADKEKARSANSGPSRNSMSVVVVGTRSDSRQTA